MPFLRSIDPGDGTTNNYPYYVERTREANTERLAEWGMFTMAGAYKACVIASNNESHKFDLVDCVHHEVVQVCVSIVREYDLMECFCIHTPQHTMQAFFPRTTIISPAESIWHIMKKAHKQRLDDRIVKVVLNGLLAH